MTTSRITGHGVDTRGICIAYGVANGVPFVAEGATKLDAEAEAVTVVYECHFSRRLSALAEWLRR